MKYTTLNNNLVRLEWDNAEHIRAACHLHRTLLPESILSKLGNLFLSKFYYSILVKEGLIDVYLYKQGNAYAGFIACTNSPFTFMDTGKKKHFLRIVLILMLSIALQPARLIHLTKMKNDPSLASLQKTYGNGIGQFLSFGVLEEYRKVIDQELQLSIPAALIKQVGLHFRNAGKKHYFLLVLKTNIAAKRFYDKHQGVALDSNTDSESMVYKFDA